MQKYGCIRSPIHPRSARRAPCGCPGILRVAGIVPGLQVISFLVAGVWMLVAMVVAVRQALDYESTARAVVVCIIGWFVQLVIVSITLAYVASHPDAA